MHRHHILAGSLVCLSFFGLPLSESAGQSPEPQPLKSASAPEGSKQAKQNGALETPAPISAGTILSRWSAASRFLSPEISQSKVEEFKKGNRSYFTGHELSLISEFQKPVTTQSLLADFEWRVISQSKSTVILRGQPKDTLTRRLCRPFELQINPESMLPESLTFLSDSPGSQQGFGAIELTALKSTMRQTTVAASEPAQFVSHQVMKATFPQTASVATAEKAATSPIKRVSFSKTSSEMKNETELQEIEKLVTRWILESQRIDSILLSNGATILRPGDTRKVTVPAKLYTQPDGTIVSGWLPYQGSLQPWLIDVDQKSFLIESFTIELTTDETGPNATRFVTLKLKPNPDSPAPTHPGFRWEEVEIEFSSRHALPVKVSTTKQGFVHQYLLSDMQVKYAK